MTTYNTGNPLGSTDVLDRYDNSENLDNLVNGPEVAYDDRLGVSRKSWRGFETDFNTFLAASGFETPVLTYNDGFPLQVDRPTQLLERASDPGTLYSIKLPSAFPVILSGTWAADEPLLVIRTDNDLRQDLANGSPSLVDGAVVGVVHPLASSIRRSVTETLADYVSILNWIDPAEHAAIRDRTTTFDCGPAIRTAVAAVPVGTSIYFPYGLYLAGKALPGDAEVVSINKAGVRFVGEGTIRRAENNTGYFLRIAANDVTLEGLEIDGNRGATGIPDSPGFGSTIRSVGFVRGSVLRCRVINSAGQAIGVGAGCDYWRVEGNYFENFFSTAIQFAAEKTDVVGCNFNLILGNYIKGDLPVSARFCNGIFLTTSATTETHDTHFCDFNVVANNIIEDVPDTGIESGYKCRYTLIEGNTVRRSFNADILVRDNRHSIVDANIIAKRTGHASSFRHGIYVDGLSITGDAAPITNAYCVVTNNNIQGAEQSGISLIAAERSIVSGNMVLGVATNNGSTGINIKSGYSNVFGNTCQDFQFLFRFSLESQRALSNQIVLARCFDNIGINGANGIMLDATTAMALNDCEVYGNRFTNVSSGTISQSGAPTFFNTRVYNNIDRSNPHKGMPSQPTTTAVIQSPGGIQRLNAGAQFGTVAAFDRYVAGIVSIKMGNEVALFKTEGDGTITAISESTNIGVAAGTKLYRLEALTGSFVVKRYDAAVTYASFQASLL